MQGISCKQCGICCKAIRMMKEDEKPPFFKEIPKEKAFEVFPVNELYHNDDVGYYECTSLTEDNKCSIQTTKPDLCRMYPYVKEIDGKKIEQIVHPDCAFFNKNDKFDQMVKQIDDLFHNNKEQYEIFLEEMKRRTEE
jgi:Fe-S-cluster containining protein